MPFSVCQKTCFLTDCQRSKEPLRQATRSRRRTGGTVGSELCSKSKSLAQQAFSPLIRQKPEIFSTFPLGRVGPRRRWRIKRGISVCRGQNFVSGQRTENFGHRKRGRLPSKTFGLFRFLTISGFFDTLKKAPLGDAFFLYTQQTLGIAMQDVLFFSAGQG